MVGSDIDLGFLRSLCGRKTADHHATNLHQGTAQNLSPPRIFWHLLTMGGNFNRRTAWVASGNSSGLGFRVTGGMVTDSQLIDADVQQLRANFAGRLLRPTDERYEEVRAIWNGAIRRRPCLLYTSDAADERSSVDLGGRRIINKKKNQQSHVHR